MSTKTTTKDFRLFKKACEYWVKRFGLTEWKVSYEHGDREHQDGVVQAACAWYMRGRTVNFILGKNYDEEVTDLSIVESAFHEVMELVLVPIRQRTNNADYNYHQQDNFQAECAHEIMHRIYHAFQQGIDKDNKKIIKEFNDEGNKHRSSKIPKRKEGSTKD